MENIHFDGKFFGTYYYANIIQGVLDNQFEYLRRLDDFYGDDKYLPLTAPFQRYSAFHSFIEFVLRQVIFEDQQKIDLGKKKARFELNSHIEDLYRHEKPGELPIEFEFREYGIQYTSFQDWLRGRQRSFEEADDDDVYDYFDELHLEGSISELVEKSVNEAFFILFQNRMVLLKFNGMISNCITNNGLDLIPEEFSCYFTRGGTLKRQPIPKWARRAVFFRDRGRCTNCNKDLSGLLSLSNLENFDHIVPLALGGLNDVSNIQLLCSHCNNRKSGKTIGTSTRYESWYPLPPPGA